MCTNRNTACKPCGVPGFNPHRIPSITQMLRTLETRDDVEPKLFHPRVMQLATRMKRYGVDILNGPSPLSTTPSILSPTHKRRPPLRSISLLPMPHSHVPKTTQPRSADMLDLYLTCKSARTVDGRLAQPRISDGDPQCYSVSHGIIRTPHVSHFGTVNYV